MTGENSNEDLRQPPSVRKRSSTGKTTYPHREEPPRIPTQEEMLPETDIVEQPYIGEMIQKVPTIVDNEHEKSLGNLWGYAYLGSELLENKGPVARDHMANERTFLSWIRTSLGLVTVGVGITQLLKLVESNSTNADSRRNGFAIKVGKPIGATFITIAILCVILGTSRFFRTQHLLKEDKYPASRFSVSVLVFLILCISVVTLVSVLYDNTR